MWCQLVAPPRGGLQVSSVAYPIGLADSELTDVALVTGIQYSTPSTIRRSNSRV